MKIRLLEKNYRENDFVYAHKRFSDPRDILHLTPEEFYLYSTLYTLRMKDDSIIVNIHLIDRMLQIPFDKRPSRNKSIIRTILLQLVEKKIYITHNSPRIDKIISKRGNEKEELIKKLSYDDVLKFTVNDEYLKSEINNKQWKGFVRFPFTEIKKFKDIKKMYIYFSVFAKEAVEGEATISYEEWSRILQSSYKTAVKHVNECIVNEDDHKDGQEFIYVRRGEFINEYRKRREINVYSTTPFDSNSSPVIRRISDRKSNDNGIIVNNDGVSGNARNGDNGLPF